MRVVIAGIQPIGIHCTQILDLELDERFGELGLIAELDSKFIWEAR